MHRNHATTIELGGFRIGFDWSVLIVLALIAWSLATQVLPTGFPGHSNEAYWVAALVAAGLFLGSLVMHELSHAVTARRVAGAEVEDITFWLFGGVARIRGELPTPRLQLLVAGVGPLTSLWGVALLLAKLGAGTLAAGTVLWLGVMNGTLAVFNLIPGSPLDGGRVLHAILWRLRGDRTRAALTAARVGEGVGAVLIGLGVLGFVLAGNGGGLWTALIGWFVLGAARGEAQIAGLRTGLGDRRVREVMSTEPVEAPAWFTVETFLDRLVALDHQVAFPVREFDGYLSGLVTLEALRRLPPERRLQARVGHVAQPLARTVTVAPEESAVMVAARLAMTRQSLALVLDEGQLVGVVSQTDLSRATALGRSLARSGRSAEPAAPSAPPRSPHAPEA